MLLLKGIETEQPKRALLALGCGDGTRLFDLPAVSIRRYDNWIQSGCNPMTFGGCFSREKPFIAGVSIPVL